MKDFLCELGFSIIANDWENVTGADIRRAVAAYLARSTDDDLLENVSLPVDASPC